MRFFVHAERRPPRAPWISNDQEIAASFTRCGCHRPEFVGTAALDVDQSGVQSAGQVGGDARGA
jgi:hypothetical protein